jgi:hypothetical protein
MSKHSNPQTKSEALIFEQREFRTAREAIQYARAGQGLAAIRLEGTVLVVSRQAAEQLELAGIGFAFLHELYGRIMTVPVNDRED